MNTETARTMTLTVTDAALAAALSAGKTSDDLFLEAQKAIAAHWVEVCDFWGETSFELWAPHPGGRFAGRFVSFMARFGGPDEPDVDLIPRQIVIMTLDEARSE